MKRSLLSLVAVLLVLAAHAGQVQAQGMMRTEPLDPNDPRAKRAVEATEALLTADVGEALQRLAEITLSAARGDGFVRQVEDVVRAIGTPGAFRISQVAPGPGGVMVLLVPEGAGQAMGLIVQMEAAEPHHLIGFRHMAVQLTSPGS